MHESRGYKYGHFWRHEPFIDGFAPADNWWLDANRLARATTVPNQRCHRPFRRSGNPSAYSHFCFIFDGNECPCIFSFMAIWNFIFLKEDSNWREKNGSLFPQWKLDHSWGKAASEGAPGVGTADPQATTARLRGPRPQWSMGAAWQVSLGHRTTRSTCRSCSVEDAGSDD